ncbi:MAG: zinc ribbon domain-containing protein [Dehalococcoidia bacterium]
MSFGERYEEHRLPFGDDAVWGALLATLAAPGSGFHAIAPDPVLRRVTAKTLPSAWSWGERVTAEVGWLADDRSVVRLRSAPRVHLNVLAGRRNARNLARILDGIATALRSTGEAALRPALVFCPRCRTPNPGDAERCSACAASLAPPPPQSDVPVFAPSRSRGRSRGVAIAVGVVGMVAIAAGAGAYAVAQSRERGPAFDPREGARLAEAGLIDTADLPGVGWTIVPDEDDGSSTPEGASAECAAFFAETEAFPDQFDAALAGRATRDFERSESGGPSSPTSVGVDVRVLHDTAVLRGAVDRFRALFERSEAVPCLEQTFAQPGLTIAVERVAASSAVPQGGAALAYDIAFTLPEQLVVFRVEAYVWTLGNAIVELDVSGERGSTTSEAARTAVVRTADLLRRAAAEPHPPPASPTP